MGNTVMCLLVQDGEQSSVMDRVKELVEEEPTVSNDNNTAYLYT